MYKQQMPDKTDTEDGMTICRSYSRQAVNSLCETMIRAVKDALNDISVVCLLCNPGVLQ